MTQSKFVSSEAKSGYSPEEIQGLENKIKAALERANELNSDNLETKAEMALKNQFISPQQEKELFDLVNNSDGLYERYKSGERTEDLLASLEQHCQLLEQKRNEIFPAAPQDAKLKLAKEEEGVSDKRRPLKIEPKKEVRKKEPGEGSEEIKEIKIDEALVAQRAAEIQQRRINNEKGFEWEKIDDLLRQKGLAPGTPEAEEFMAKWDKNTAQSELRKEEIKRRKEGAEDKKEKAPEKEPFLKIKPAEKAKAAVSVEEIIKEPSEQGAEEKERELARKGTEITLSKITDYKELWAENEQAGDEKFKEKTRELWKEFAVHGKILRDKKDGKIKPMKFTDLDGNASLGLLELAGINTKNVEHKEPGKYDEGRINIDTGERHGIIVEDGGKTVFIDHHSDQSGKDSSATKFTYDLLVSLGLLEKQEYLDKLVEFVTQEDNKAYPNEEKYFKNYGRNLLGLKDHVKFKHLLAFFKDGHQPHEVLQDKELKKMGLLPASEQKRLMVEKALSELEKIKDSGAVIDSARYGKIAVDIGKKIPFGFDAIRFAGYQTYLSWSPADNSFFISSVNPIVDSFAQGKKIRGHMWINPMSDEIPLKVNLKDVLTAMTDGKFEPTGELAEFITKEAQGEAGEKKIQPAPESKADWDKSAMLAAESGWDKPAEVDMDESAIITAETGGLKTEVSKEQESTGEKPGASEKSPIELTEVVGESGKESKEAETEAALAKARSEYVVALAAKEKAEKEENKLTGLRARIKEFIVGGFSSYEGDKTRLPARQAKIGGAQAEAKEAQERFIKAQENLKVSIRAYRDGEVAQIEKKAREFKLVEKTEEETKEDIEKQAKGILLATTLREAAIIEDLKAQQQIEQMGKARRFINEKAEEFADWYKTLPWQAKVGISAGLTGVGILTGSAAVLTAVFAGQASLRALGGAMTTAGVEKLAKGLQEKSAEKKLTKEFDGKFLEALRNQNDALDDKLFEMVKGQQSAKNKRMVAAGLVGGIVGTGVLATAVKEAFGWGGGVKAPKAGEATTLEVQPDNVAGKGSLGSIGSDEPGTENAMLEEPPGAGQLKPEAAAEAAGGLKESTEIISLKIGSRGPEGAIIDYLKSSEVLAKQYGWDGETDLKKWADTKAHQLWLKSVEGELAKPGMADKLTAQGFTVDAEGYAKAMHKIGQGFVELDGQGRLSLSDNTSFLKTGVPALEELGGTTEAASIAEPPAPQEPIVSDAPEPSTTMPEQERDIIGEIIQERSKAALSDEEQILFNKISKQVVEKIDPAVLNDKTFKAAGKITLGQLLAEVPAEAYKDKFAESNYWYSLSEPGAKVPNLPGTGFLGDLSYNDWRKYAEMAKFLRENPVLKGVTGLKNMTLEEFFHLYGEDLGKK